MRSSRLGSLVGLIFLLSATVWAGGGLRINNYAEVLVQNLQIGSQYSMTELVNLPLETVNNFDKAIKVKFSSVQPALKLTKPGYEPIPDAAWVTFDPKEAEIPAAGTFRTDVKIKIPDDPKYLGKKFQVGIVAAQVPDKAAKGGMVSISVELQGRMLFSITPKKMAKPAGLKEQKVDLNFTFTPGKIVMENVPLGRKVQVLNEEKKPVALENLGPAALKCRLISLNPKETEVVMQPDYLPAPSSDFLEFKTDEMNIGPKQKQSLDMTLEIPDKPEFHGKKYIFLLSVSTGNATMGRRYFQIWVTTKK